MADDPRTAGGDGNNAVAQAIVILGPYLLAMLVTLFFLHLQYQPTSSLRSLMKRYRKRGIVVEGQVLSCELKNAVPKREQAMYTTYIVEIMYERSEHKYASDPSKKFRNPQQMQKKNFVKSYELNRKVGRGDKMTMLCLPENARTGCPKEIVEQILSRDNEKVSLDALVLGLAFVLILFVVAARAVLRMDEPILGCKILLLGMAIAEGVPWIYCTDQFLKMKRKRFDNARLVKLTKSGKSK